MLTARQFEGIGRLTIAFNELDKVIEVYLPLVTQYFRVVVPAPNTLRSFRKRATAFRTALEVAASSNELAAAYISSVFHFLDLADVIATKRNEYVHATAFIDFPTNTRMLQMRSGSMVPNEMEVFNLASEAAFVASKLAEECEDLLRHYLSLSEGPMEFEPLDEWNEEETAE